MNKEQKFSGMVYNEERSIAADEVKNLWMAVKVLKRSRVQHSLQ